MVGFFYDVSTGHSKQNQSNQAPTGDDVGSDGGERSRMGEFHKGYTCCCRVCASTGQIPFHQYANKSPNCAMTP